MVTERPLSLTDHQLQLVKDAARALAPHHREDFPRRVTAHLSGEPSDAEVSRAITAALDRTPIYFTDGKPKGESP